jgi:hypothetical protein
MLSRPGPDPHGRGLTRNTGLPSRPFTHRCVQDRRIRVVDNFSGCCPGTRRLRVSYSIAHFDRCVRLPVHPLTNRRIASVSMFQIVAAVEWATHG